MLLNRQNVLKSITHRQNVCRSVTHQKNVFQIVTHRQNTWNELNLCFEGGQTNKQKNKQKTNSNFIYIDYKYDFELSFRHFLLHFIVLIIFCSFWYFQRRVSRYRNTWIIDWLLINFKKLELIFKFFENVHDRRFLVVLVNIIDNWAKRNN